MSGAIPPEITPTEKVGFCVEVPNSSEWLGLVTGALLKLGYNYYWNQDYENWEEARDAGKAIVSSWLEHTRCDNLFCSGVIAALGLSDGTVNGFLEQLIALAAEQCSESLATEVEEGINALTPSFAVRANPEEPCQLEFSTDGSETWTQFADVSTCGAQGIQGETGEQGEQGIQGIQGEQGEQGIQGEPGADGSDCDNCQTSPNPVGEDSRVKACSVAYGVTQWLFEKFSDSLDLIAELVIADRALLDMVSDIIEAIPVVGNVVEFTVDLVTNLATADITALHACDTTDFRDDVYCKLFCQIGDDGIITDEILTAWADDVEEIGTCSGITTTIGAGLKNIMLAIGGAAFRQRGFIYSNGEAPCPDCEDCPGEWVFFALNGQDNHEFLTMVDGLDGQTYSCSWNSGSDSVLPGTAGNGAQYISFQIDVSAATTITRIIMGTTNPGATGRGITANCDITNTDFLQANVDAFDVAPNVHIDCISYRSGSFNPGQEVRSIEIHGTGTNPFA